ncbi:MAG TPA: ankyrin repeat domain-containing protein [Vicinamibacterales bacterium]|nr:ankyrin repeat domain-containing protein [Vicinamibacterales bacterium]
MRIAALLATVWLVSVGISSAQGRLIDAVRANDAGAVRTLLDARADANAVQPDGTTALHWAVERDAIEIVQLLIRAGANVKTTNRYGATPLWLASLNGNAATIGVLLEAGADPSAASDEGETALMVAARTGKIDAVNLLLARGADPNVKEQWRGQTALMWAAAEGYAPVIETLVARGADVSARSNGGFTAILFAAREGRIAAVDALIKAGADMNDSLPIRKRAPQNAPPPPPDPGPNAFLLAAANAHYELAAWLLDRGADPNAAPQGFTALHQVSWVRKAGIAGSNNPAPQGSGTMDSLAFVGKLVAKGATLDTRVTKKPNMGVTTLNSIGATPFLLAARTADAPLMKLLAELGANPLLTNEDGSTPLMVAAGVGTNAPGEDPGTEPEVLDAVRVALDLGNDLNVVDKNGETAMHGAAYKHVPTVVHYLADKGARADVWNRPNSKGWTPLKIAEGVQRGMNIVSSPVTATAIRQVLAASSPAVQ